MGTKGWVGLQGGWVWAWKDSIDRAFMLKYGDELPDMMAAKGGCRWWMMAAVGSQWRQPTGADGSRARALKAARC